MVSKARCSHSAISGSIDRGQGWSIRIIGSIGCVVVNGRCERVKVENISLARRGRAMSCEGASLRDERAGDGQEWKQGRRKSG